MTLRSHSIYLVGLVFSLVSVRCESGKSDRQDYLSSIIGIGLMLRRPYL